LLIELPRAAELGTGFGFRSHIYIRCGCAAFDLWIEDLTMPEPSLSVLSTRISGLIHAWHESNILSRISSSIRGRRRSIIEPIHQICA